MNWKVEEGTEVGTPARLLRSHAQVGEQATLLLLPRSSVRESYYLTNDSHFGQDQSKR